MSHNPRKRKDCADSENLVTNPGVPQAPVAKKVKSGKTQNARPRNVKKRGKVLPGLLPGLPLNIVFVVFKYLKPNDLLNLARTTKELREFLMSRKKSSQFWKMARGKIEGLPDCPSFLSEPAYANLCFQSNCHNCSAKKIDTVIWSSRARYCNPCKELLHIDRSENREALAEYRSVLRGVPLLFEARLLKIPGRRRRATDLEEFTAHFSYHVPDLQKAKIAFEKVAPRNQEKWLKEREKWCKQIEKWRKECGIWYAKKCRLEAVIAKLTAAGWKEDLLPMKDLQPHPLSELWPVARSVRPLTIKAWREMKDELIEFMESRKAKRLAST